MEQLKFEQATKIKKEIEFKQEYLDKLNVLNEKVDKNIENINDYQPVILIQVSYGNSTPLAYSDAKDLLVSNIMKVERDIKKLQKQFDNL